MAPVRRISLIVAVLAGLLVGCGTGAISPSTTDDLVSPTTAAAPAAVTTIPVRAELRETVTLVINGQERSYDLFVPGGFPDAAAPLVLDLHGLLGTPEAQDELSGMQAKARLEGFVVAQPTGLALSWDTITGNGEDVAFLRGVVADVATRTAIDQNRVFATGMSNGGGMVDRLGCVAGDVFAAVAPVAGWYVPTVECDTDVVVPILAIHGTDDPVVPYDGEGSLFVPVREWAGDWATRNGCDPEAIERNLTTDVTSVEWTDCDADVSLLVVEGGGHGWPGTTDQERTGASTASIDATDLIWEFFTRHTNG